MLYKLRVVVFGAVFAAVLLTLYFGAAVGASRTLLSVEKRALELGRIWQQDSIIHVLPVKNNSGRDLLIKRVEASCGCTAVNPSSFTIRPGATQEIQLTINLTPTNAIAPLPANRDFSVSIGIEGVDPEVHATFSHHWQLVGHVESVISIDPPVLDYGDVTVGVLPDPRTIRIRNFVPLSDLGITCDGTEATASVVSYDVGDNVRIIDVHPQLRRQEGPFAFSLRFKPITRAGEALPEVALVNTGFVVSDVQIVPGSLLLSPDARDASPSEQILIVSRTGRAFTVEQVDCDRGEVDVSDLATDGHWPRQSAKFLVSARPDRAGHGYKGRIRFLIRRAGSGDSKVTAETLPVTIIAPHPINVTALRSIAK